LQGPSAPAWHREPSAKKTGIVMRPSDRSVVECKNKKPLIVAANPQKAMIVANRRFPSPVGEQETDLPAAVIA
jgi:hypothetical protein